MADINITTGASSASWKDYLPLISSSIVIILFIVDRWIQAHLRSKEVERNWYLKVLVEPSIDKISKFHKQTRQQYSKSFEALKEAIDSAQSTTEYLDLVTSEIGKFQKIKRTFESEVVFPIQKMYPDVGQELTELLLNLEDEYTEALTSEAFTDDEKEALIKSITSCRALFLDNLYAPIRLKPFRVKSLFSFFKGPVLFFKKSR